MPVVPAAAAAMSGRLWLLFALFIVYATTIPFEFRHDSQFVRDKVAGLQWNPFVGASGRRLSIPDAVQNVMLFVPFGLLGSLTCGRRLSRPAVLAVVTTSGVALSAAVETLQLFTADRVASLSDVMSNGFGAFAGAAVVDVAGRRITAQMRVYGSSRWMTGPWTYAALVALGVLVVAAWQPFDLTLDVSTVGSKIRALWRDPWQRGPITDEGSALVLYALGYMALAKWLEASGVRRPWLGAAVAASSLAVALELSQVLVTSRMPAASDAAIRLAGVGAGVALLPLVNRSESPRPWLALLLLATVVSAALSTWSPFQLRPVRQPFAWIPFLGYYGTNWFPAVSHVMELMVTYFPLGFLTASTRATPSPALVSAASVAVIAWGVEYGQSWFAGRHPDITDIAFSVAGAVIGAWIGDRGAELFGRARAANAR